MEECRLKQCKTVKCDGEYIPSERLCLRHAVLFDVWIANGGFRVYKFNPEPEVEYPTIGDNNSDKLRRWKRAQFHKWLDTLTDDDVIDIMKNG